MAKKKGFGISPITNTIYYGTQDTEKHVWIGQKIDVTNEVIDAVYAWFMGNMEDSEGKKEEYQISYPSTEFELVMRRKKTENIQLGKVRKILKNIEDIIIPRARDSEKLKALKQYEDDIKTAKDIINGKLTYCEECKDYYFTKSFFSEKETVPTKICVYEDPINSGGNDYVDGYADILYSVCPKGHKHVVDRKERRK